MFLRPFMVRRRRRPDTDPTTPPDRRDDLPPVADISSVVLMALFLTRQ
ncbi:hypothetical protein PRN20_07425 [Devosia sp. ZB163]|nr:hypothetical protein [Devosia sp. ZB163]MDC9823558.1 hypothetical protein [Devosia sp. ZB163]